MNPRLAIVLLIGACVFLAPRITRAEDSPGPGKAAVIGRLPLDTRLHPALATAHPIAIDDAGAGKLAVYFIVLVGLVIGGYFILKRGLPLRAVRGSETRLHLRETKMLGNRQFLVVAEYEGNRILLGVGPGRIEYLCPLDSGEERADLPLPSRDPQ